MVFLNVVGWIIAAILFLITMYFGLQVDKTKKNNDIQTYKEIVAFTEGKQLDEIQKAHELAIRPYQKIILPIAFGLGAFVICSMIGGICYLIKLFFG
jgi:hypothetical protein